METQHILNTLFVDLPRNYGDITVPKPDIWLHIVILRFFGIKASLCYFVNFHYFIGREWCRWLVDSKGIVPIEPKF